jgi:hypothetical protein
MTTAANGDQEIPMTLSTASVTVSEARAMLASLDVERNYRVVDRKMLAPGHYIVIRRHITHFEHPKDHCIGPFQFAVQARAFYDLYVKERIAHDLTPCTAYLVNTAENPADVGYPGTGPS